MGKMILICLFALGCTAVAQEGGLSPNLMSAAGSEFFNAPVVGNKTNLKDAPAGTIVFEQTSNTPGLFWGLPAGVDPSSAGNWVQLSPTFGTNTISSSSGSQIIEKVSFGGNATLTTACTASPCFPVGATSGVLSVTRSAMGTYSLNFNSGVFSTVPTCTCAEDNGPSTGSICNVVLNGSTVIGVNLITKSVAGALADGAMHVICMGTH